MTDEQNPTDSEQSSTATEDDQPQTEENPKDDLDQEVEESEQTDGESKEDEKLEQEVTIVDIGPCKKHIKVSVAQKNIQELFDAKFAELMTDAQVPGFRPGKAPRRIVTRRFQKEVSQQIKGQVLMASLEQLAEDHDVAPLSAPEIDPGNIEIKEGEPFLYEFDVEVRPEFDLPEYRGLKLKRPIKTFTEEEVANEEHRILSNFGKRIPKTEGGAEDGDYLIADMTTRFQGKEIGTVKGAALRVEDKMAFKDGVAEGFGAAVRGAKAGDTREFEIVMSDAVGAKQLRGQTCQTTVVISAVEQVELPELTHEFLHKFGVHNEDQLRERVRGLMESRLEYRQRESARDQILELLVGQAEWDLPQDLLRRQARRSINRRILEMREAGMSEDEIRGRQRMLEHDVVQSTQKNLIEHFVLQKIAELEKIDADDADIEYEIERIADQNNESARRVRAQLEREDMMDSLAIQIVERKVMDMLLDEAEYEEVPMDEDEQNVATAEEQASEGELRDPTAEDAEEETQPES